MMIAVIYKQSLILSAFLIIFFSSFALAQKSESEWIEADTEAIKFQIPKNLKLVPFKSFVRNPWEFESKKLRLHILYGFYAGQDPLEKEIEQGYLERSVTIDGMKATQASYLARKPRKLKFRYFSVLYFENLGECAKNVRVVALYKAKSQEPEIERIFNSVKFDKKRLSCSGSKPFGNLYKTRVRPVIL